MSRKTLTRTGFAIAALLLVTACGDSHTSLENRGDFAQRLDSELYLPADGDKENRREVEYWKGTQLLKRVTVFYSSGGKQISVYREDGTIRLLTEWYPEPGLTTPPAEPVTSVATVPAASAPDSSGTATTSTVSSSPGSISNAPAGAASGPIPGSASTASADTASGAGVDSAVVLPSVETAQEALSTRHTSKVFEPPAKFGKVKRSIEYGVDGVTVLKSSFFREDGSMASHGKTLEDGETFEQLEYLKDGRTLARRQLYTKAGDVFYMRVGAVAPSNTVVRSLSEGRIETVVFGDDGLRITRTVKQRSGYENIEFYKADGRSLKYIVYRTYTISVLYFKDDGTIDHSRIFHDGGMTVTKFRDNAGTKLPEPVDGKYPKDLFRQSWKVVGKDANGKPTYRLSRIEEIDASGRTTRRLHFSDSTGKLNRVEYLDDEQRISRALTVREEDQTVESIDTYTYTPGVYSPDITNEKVEPGKGIRETVDSKTAAPVPFEDVRDKVEPVSQPSWYYYEGYGY